MNKVGVGLVATTAPLVALGAFVLLPSASEYGELLYRDGVLDKAHRVVANAYEDGPLSAETGLRLAKIQTHLGEVDAAMDTLTELIDSGVDDYLVVRALADLKRSLGDMKGYIDLMLTLPVDQLEPNLHDKIAGWTRYEGRHRDEVSFLSRLEDAGLASADQTQRLGMLLIVHDHLDAGVLHLARLDDAGLLKDAQARLTLLSGQLRKGQHDNAQSRARRWLSDDSDSSLEWSIDRMFEVRGISFERE